MKKNIISNKSIFVTITVIKLIMLFLFSSAYQDELFMPFVEYFINNLENPWQHYYNHDLPKSFPYPSLMLYIFAIPMMVASLTDNYLVSNILFKLPTLISDIIILWILVKLYPSKVRESIVFYFASPIILYASYMHSQLDLVPTALLFLAVYLLVQNKFKTSALIFGLAVSTKFHVIVAVPIALIYLVKRNTKWSRISMFIVIPPLTYLVFALPYIFSEGYISLVLLNSEQNQVFDVFFSFDNFKIYITPMAILLIYARFLAYPKVNNDLLYSTIGLLFSVFVLLVPPMPAWYVWVIPFISIYFINYYRKHEVTTIITYGILTIAYLVYFNFFHTTQISKLKFLSTPIEFSITKDQYINLAFTLLEVSLFTVIYLLYKYGIKSNSVYKKKASAFIIGIGGDSGSGKSTLLSDLNKLLNRNSVLHIEGDGDHKWERGDTKWSEFTHLNPKANYLHRQSEDLLALKRGEYIERVEYNHDTGKFTDPQKVRAKDYIILCGLHPFYLPKMRKAIDLKIYLETDEFLRRHWKVLRDTKKRGYTTERVLEQIESRVSDGQKYIIPQKQFADLVITYFTEEIVEVGNEECNPDIKLKLTMDSNVDLEIVLFQLEEHGIEVAHNYSEDLKSQYIIVDKDLLIDVNYEEISNNIIPNKEEILLGQSEWLLNYNGLIQLVILLIISNKMKEISEHDV